MFEIHDSLELAINIIAFFPCLILIILYLIDFKKLKFPNYFKLELMIVMLTNIILNFFKNYNYIEKKDNGQGGNGNENNEDHEGNCKQKYKIIGLIKSYLEIVNLCLLAAFNYLCYILLKIKNKDNKKLSFLIILSLISWIVPIYNLILYFLNKKDFISISGVCIFVPDLKKKLHLYLIPFIFLLDSIFFILTLLELSKRKKSDEEHKEGHKKNMNRITLNFLGHFIFFSCQYINNAFIFFDIERDGRYQYYNINYHIGLAIISIISCIEGKTREYYNKLIEKCLKFEKIDKDKIEEEEEEEDEDEDENEDMKIYHESSRTESLS